jgi:hypothetical protein
MENNWLRNSRPILKAGKAGCSGSAVVTELVTRLNFRQHARHPVVGMWQKQQACHRTSNGVSHNIERRVTHMRLPKTSGHWLMVTAPDHDCSCHDTEYKAKEPSCNIPAAVMAMHICKIVLATL